MDEIVNSDGKEGDEKMLDSFIKAVLSRSGIRPEEWEAASADVKERVYKGILTLVSIDVKGKSIELSDVATLQPIEAFASDVKQTQQEMNTRYHNNNDWKMKAGNYLVIAATAKDSELQESVKEGAYKVTQGYIKELEHVGQDYDDIMERVRPSTDIPSKYLAERHNRLHDVYGSLDNLDSILRGIPAPAPKTAAKK
jgi:hypothetical protein